MDRSHVRETHLRQSYVFQNGGTNMQRSYISTSLVNDSLNFNDDLRKYPFFYLGPEFRIYRITRKLIWVTTSNSSWSFKQ